jgi:RsbT co-antagonist protein rsbRD N-terminal domain
MILEKFLSEKRADVLKRWFDLVLETYPADTSTFLRSQKNPFANPVGNTIYQGIEKIFDELISPVSGDFSEFLDNIIRVRAVQDFSPSQAISFVFSLKKVIREELKQSFQGNFPYEEVLELEARIDALALSSFDLFMKCREKLYDIKANELRKMTFRLLQRVNDIGEGEEKKNGLTESNDDNAKEKEVSQ